MSVPDRELEERGFAIVPGVLTDEECLQVSEALQTKGTPGTRCSLDFDWCAALAISIRRHPALSSLIPPDHVAAQCTYFEKSIATNWLVPVHQDLSIPVAERIADAPLSGWSEKEGSLYVQAPVEVLQQLIAVRLHLDPCGDDDGPLRVVPGSHRMGRVDAGTAFEIRARSEEIRCTAARGSVMAMRPLLLHASSKATGSSLRRVLHILFGPPSLPHGLRWRYAV
ncbi:phytanoyl-CoA dioxygenase family protein [Lysobacter terrae]